MYGEKRIYGAAGQGAMSAEDVLGGQIAQQESEINMQMTRIGNQIGELHGAVSALEQRLNAVLAQQPPRAEKDSRVRGNIESPLAQGLAGYEEKLSVLNYMLMDIHQRIRL